MAKIPLYNQVCMQGNRHLRFGYPTWELAKLNQLQQELNFERKVSYVGPIDGHEVGLGHSL
jgi:hypothetical protein